MTSFGTDMMLIASKIWGKGCKRKEEAANKLPNDWNEFLKRYEHREQLFGYLAKESVKLEVNGKIISTHNEVVVKKEEDTSNLVPCNHEEAGSRIFCPCF